MVNIAIVGCGGIAGLRHIPALTKLKQVNISAFFDRDMERAREYSCRYGGGKVFADYEALLADTGIDAVVICTAAGSHSELSVAALKSGKHVLCEKPMATGVEDAIEMVKVSKETTKKLMISHNQRRYEPHMKARDLIKNGEIGKLLTFRTFCGIRGPEFSSVNGINNAYFNKALSGRGVMSDIGSHRIDLIQYLTGSDFEEVFSYTPTLAKTKMDGSLIDVDDNAFTIAKLSNGEVGVIITSWTSASGNDRMTMLFGSEGVIKIYGEDYPLVLERSNGNKEYFDYSYSPKQDETQLTDIDELFVRCIEEDTPPFVSGEDGLKVILVLDAMERSNISSTWEKVAKYGN